MFCGQKVVVPCSVVGVIFDSTFLGQNVSINCIVFTSFDARRFCRFSVKKSVKFYQRLKIIQQFRQYLKNLSKELRQKSWKNDQKDSKHAQRVFLNNHIHAKLMPKIQTDPFLWRNHLTQLWDLILYCTALGTITQQKRCGHIQFADLSRQLVIDTLWQNIVRINSSLNNGCFKKLNNSINPRVAWEEAHDDEVESLNPIDRFYML